MIKAVIEALERLSLTRCHQPPDRRGDDHAGGTGEDRVLPRHQTESHCDKKQDADCPNNVSDRIGRSYFCVCFLNFQLVPPKITGYASLENALVFNQ
jgi:hypothetical protein